MTSVGVDGPTIEADTTLVADGDVLVSDVGDELVVLDGEEEVYYGLNAVGAFLWEQLEEPRTVDELEEATAEAFDVPRAECREDVHAFLGDLLEADLLSRA